MKNNSLPPLLIFFLSTYVNADAVINAAQQNTAVIETLTVYGKSKADADGQQTRDAEALMPSLGIDAGERMQGVAGLQVDSRANYAQDTRITLRGFGARSAFGVRGVYLLVDGVPLTMPDGQGQLSGVLLDTSNQVQVLSGPIASLYGNASGGVVQFTTVRPQVSSLRMQLGEDELGIERQSIQAGFREENLSAIFSSARSMAEGIRPHSAAEKQQQQLQIFYNLANGIEFQYRFEHERDPLLQDPLGLTLAQWQEDPYQQNIAAETFNTRKAIEQTQNSISVKQKAENFSWQVSAWQGERVIEQYLAQSGEALTSSGGVVDLSRNYSGVNANATYNMSDVLALTLGWNHGGMEDNRLGFVNNKGSVGAKRRDETDSASNNDFYALARWQLTSRWHWLVGVRQAAIDFTVDDHWIIPGKNLDDSGRKKLHDYTGAISTGLELNDQWELSAAVGSGFETPTLAEMSYTNSDQGFNTNLEAANNLQQQMSIEFTPTLGAIRATVFSIQSQDEIVVDQSINGRTTYRNAGKTERSGVELSAQFRLTPQWAWQIAAAQLTAEYASGSQNGKQIPGVAQQTFYSKARYYPWSNEHLLLEWQTYYRASVAANDDNQLWAPAYVKHDLALRSRWNLKQNAQAYWEVWGLLANIMNKIYVGSVIVNQANGRAFEAAEPRHWSLGLNLGLNFQ